MISRIGVVFMRLIAPLPLPLVRGLGKALGWLLYLVVPGRRHVVRVNLDLCFPQWTEEERRALVPRVFIAFAQAWLDRSWLWHGNPNVVRRRVKLTGAVDELHGMEPTVVFWPHFVGMDSGWTALTLDSARPYMTIYTHQANRVVDEWILRGRQRFGNVRLFRRTDGVKAVVSALREGTPLCLLPDMNFGPEESIFVPFYGVPAATVPSLSRFARLGRAKVVPVLTRIVPGGYEVQVLPAWRDFPSDDLEADTALMNERLQDYIDGMPDQYYWVHKRFKTRPAGAGPVY
ncbi:LpxL/LpxP family acyltransferase [Ramlibacter humi]|uniref:Lipid A biosynthesis acyltransferase n=1 Tax=Ramlibacter humi TaxID=2530451 RepID=A0A4Z0BKT1_9BURK|nr:lipid A biosynthesis acyltransferase [Ramlibacter humi]TFY99019.1 lipid A biosynthesis acyltransferase [Ramlibacter humi]